MDNKQNLCWTFGGQKEPLSVKLITYITTHTGPCTTMVVHKHRTHRNTITGHKEAHRVRHTTRAAAGSSCCPVPSCSRPASSGTVSRGTTSPVAGAPQTGLASTHAGPSDSRWRGRTRTGLA